MLFLADGMLEATWVGAIGQGLGALFTAAAIVVALWIAGRDSRQRQAEDDSRAEARAFTIAVVGPETRPRNVTKDDPEFFPGIGSIVRSEVGYVIANHSGLPIMHVSLFVDTDDRYSDGRKVESEVIFVTPVIASGTEKFVPVKGRKTFTGTGLLWMDPDGRGWQRYDGLSEMWLKRQGKDGGAAFRTS